MEEKELEVSFDAKRKLIDIMADNPTLVKIGGKEYKIKGLRSWSRIKIADVYLKIEAPETQETQNIILKESFNIKYAAEIIAIILLNHTFTEDENDNNERIRKMTIKVLLETTDENDWTPIIMEALNSMNVEAVFQISELARLVSSLLTTRKTMIVEQLQSMQGLQ